MKRVAINQASIHCHDVIIVGGGLTGLRAALRVRDVGLNVAVVSKVHPLQIPFCCGPGRDECLSW